MTNIYTRIIIHHYLFYIFFQCTGNIKIKTKQQPLKMILIKNTGSHHQTDLIELPPYKGFWCMLRLVDQLSQYIFVAALS